MTIQLMSKPNFFIFTGGPGAGKTTVLNELEKKGHIIVPEAARNIIKAQRLIGGNANHTGDKEAYCELMLKQSILDYQSMSTIKKPVFFDRGIPDLFSYAKRFHLSMLTQTSVDTHNYRYNPNVFLFPYWAEIYTQDTERKQTPQEALDTYESVKLAHAECGYRLIDVPKVSIKERIDFILQVVHGSVKNY